MKKIAVVLSGCGHKDGAEITESVSLLVSLSKLNCEVHFFAMNENFLPKNHITNQIDAHQTRNILEESARIARGKIRSLDELQVKDFQGLAFPGGFGAALHLCNWAEKGAQCEVNSSVVKVVQDFHRASKPIGAICIAPVILAKVLGEFKISLTIGNSSEVIKEINKTGAIHELCPVNDFITDRYAKVITTPAYMYDEARPDEVFEGISGLARELVEMA